MGKKAKEHRKKIQARNTEIKNKQSNLAKRQREFFMNLIKEEQKNITNENSLLPTTDQDLVDGMML